MVVGRLRGKLFTRKDHEFPSFMVLSIIAHALLLLGLAISGARMRASAAGYHGLDEATTDALAERWNGDRALDQPGSPGGPR